MKYLWFAKQKIPLMIVSIGLILICLLTFRVAFTDLVAEVEPDWYMTESRVDGEDHYWIEVLNRDAVMPGINGLFIEAGFIQWMGIVFLMICVLPVFWILNDYHGTGSIRTIMRLPISPTWYYLDKLFPTLLLLASYWIIQYLILRGNLNDYLGVYPEELRPANVHITMWDPSPINLLYPLSDPARLPAAIAFAILIPAAVILSVFAVKSGRRGVLSGIIAGAGFITSIFYFLELPVAYWLTPLTTVTVILTSIWHINKVKIT